MTIEDFLDQNEQKYVPTYKNVKRLYVYLLKSGNMKYQKSKYKGKIKILLIDNRNWDFEKFVWVVLKYLALDLNFYFFFDKS